jgi:malonate transporter
MAAIVASLVPVFFLVILGYGLKKTLLSKRSFWDALERLVYFLLFPALIVHNLSQAPLAGMDLMDLAASLLLSTFVVSGLLLLVKRYFRVDGAAFTSIFMGSTRFNTYIGIAVAGSLYGEMGLVIASVAIAVLVPQVNILSILVLTKFASRPKRERTWYSELILIVTNPLILASGLGIFLSLRSLQLPHIMDSLIYDMGAASLPLGLMAVGAGLKLKTVFKVKSSLIWTAFFKLFVMPLTTILICYLMGVEGIYVKVAVLFACLPSASTAYILSRQLGGDAPLMAAIITTTTILAAATMPLFLLLQ